MARFAVIDAGRVTNHAEADAAFAAVQGWVPAGASSVGDLWDGHVFTPGEPAPEPVPFSVSSRQGQLELLDAGYLDAVETAINSIVDPKERRIAQIEFGATMWERSNPFLQSMWAMLGGDSAGLDDLFRRAIKR